MKLLLDTGKPLILTSRAMDFAQELAAAFKWRPGPDSDVIFTSGQRTPYEQGWAMAGNIVAPTKEHPQGNRHWISDLYLYRPIAVACQQWLDQNPKVTTRGAIANGLTKVLSSFTPDELGKFSKHLSGNALDLKPRPDLGALLAWMEARAAEARIKFLTEECHLPRWHADVLR